MKSFFNQYLNLTEEEYDIIASKGRERFFKKNQLVFVEGGVFTRLLFVSSGIIRSYRIVDGEDITYSFFATNDFACDYASFLEEKPTPFTFVALADTKVVEWTKPVILELYNSNPKFERFGRLMAERAYLNVVNRMKEFQTDDLETRYLKLMQRSPTLLLTVPQHYIASMLGVKPQSLSRIKAKLAKRM